MKSVVKPVYTLADAQGFGTLGPMSLEEAIELLQRPSKRELHIWSAMFNTATRLLRVTTIVVIHRGWTIERNQHGLLVVCKGRNAFPLVLATDSNIERAKAVIDKLERNRVERVAMEILQNDIADIKAYAEASKVDAAEVEACLNHLNYIQ